MIIKKVAVLLSICSFAAAYKCHKEIGGVNSQAVPQSNAHVVKFLDSVQHRAESLSNEITLQVAKRMLVRQAPVMYSNDEKILPTPDKVEQKTPGAKTARLLFDGDVKTAWFTGWEQPNYPQSCTVDLGGAFTLYKLRIYDGTGQPTLTVTDQNGDLILLLPLTMYEQWHNITFPGIKGITKLNFSLTGPEGDKVLTEVEIFGQREDGTVTPPDSTITNPPDTITPPKKNVSDGFDFGVNGFHWVPSEQLQPFTQWRHFIQWKWMEAERGKYRFEPTWQGDGNYDTHLSKLKSIGIDAILCINQSPDFIVNTYPVRDEDVRPCEASKDAESPFSYADYARFWFQVAARYGRKKWPENALSVDDKPRWNGEPVNAKKSGLDVLKYCEIWNEPDKWWKGQGPANITPEQYAAILSACYDGHEGAIPNAGVKVADNSMQVVMAGLTRFDSAYIERMAIWFKKNRRDGRFPCDVMNFHHYCNADGGIFYGKEHGISPEYDDVAGKMKSIASVCARVNPGAKLWWSEFGYDTDGSGPHQAKGFAGYTPEQVQGIWIVRSYLEAIAAGFDAAHIYNAIDEPNPKAGLFKSSGILTGQNGVPKFSPKGSYQIVVSAVNALRGYKCIYSAETNGVRTMLFALGGSIKAAVWMPCAENCSRAISIAGKQITATEAPQILEIF